MHLKKGVLFIHNTDFDHIMGWYDADDQLTPPAELFRKALDIEMGMHGIDGMSFRKIVWKR